MPEAPDPNDLEEWETVRARALGKADVVRTDGAVDVRLCEPIDPEVGGPGAQRNWMRLNGTLPDDPLIHTAMLVYASDRTLLSTAARPHGLPWGKRIAASLDHAVWIHRPVRFDSWLLYASESPVAHAARGLVFGAMYYEDGTPRRIGRPGGADPDSAATSSRRFSAPRAPLGDCLDFDTGGRLRPDGPFPRRRVWQNFSLSGITPRGTSGRPKRGGTLAVERACKPSFSRDKFSDPQDRGRSIRLAKLSQVLRDERRKKLIAKYAEKRAELRKRLNDRNVSIDEKLQIQVEFAKLPRNSCPTRSNSRCLFRPLARLLPQVRHLSHRFRELALKGQLPGVRKSSW